MATTTSTTSTSTTSTSTSSTTTTPISAVSDRIKITKIDTKNLMKIDTYVVDFLDK